MKIVVLDGHTLNPGDLSWSDLRELGSYEIHARTPPDLVLERATGADVLLTNKVVLDERIIAALPDLRYIGVLATGYNVVDVDAAVRRGIVVTNVPAYSTTSVAQLTFALILELTHSAGEHSRSVRDGQWASCPDFSYTRHPLVELAGLTLGIVGFGNIGHAVAGIGRAFGMKVLVHTRSPSSGQDAVLVALDALFAESDVVSLHCPLTPETRHLADGRRIGLMRPGAYLINTARGPLVDEHALAEALRQGRIAGAGLDVLSVEPPHAGNPLLGAPNCVITPHVAWATVAARKRLMAEVIGNLRAWLEGRKRNVVTK